MAEIVIVFDFDRTLIDGDSDNWVVTEMGLTEIFHQLRFTLPWNRLMDRMMMELHSQGRSIDDIEACLRKMPIDSQIVEAIKSAKSLGCDLKIVSDANKFFIEKILEQHNLLDCFSEIYTNPTSVDENGKLRILPYHSDGSVPHICNLCPSNLCKGLVMDHIRGSSHDDQIPTRFIYLGDGGGDFCPTLKLRECDCVMPRTNYPLWKRISDNSSLIKAQVKEWSNAEELQRILMQLVTTITKEDS
uniref:Inorganic pyrophosphatase 3 n=1 Tax=Noccaea caerulescens TaxID=107243 RepID=A0A1J3J2W0_NOCCA